MVRVLKSKLPDYLRAREGDDNGTDDFDLTYDDLGELTDDGEVGVLHVAVTIDIYVGIVVRVPARRAAEPAAPQLVDGL